VQSELAYDSYSERLFLAPTIDAPKLRSNLNNEQFLDVMSAPSAGKGAKRKNATREKELIEISDESDEEDES
jgi:DNA-directed RNA polymerase-3 subunit RPC5